MIQTTRFGAVSFEQDDVIHFPDGILGFADFKKFIVIDDPSDDIFAWLQSCDEPGIAFPILEPELFAPDYRPEISKADLQALQLKESSEAKFLNIVTIPEDPTKMTANLKAPIVLNMGQKVARQCVLQDNHLAIREPIFTRLQQRVVQNPTQPIRSQTPTLGVAIRIPELEA